MESKFYHNWREKSVRSRRALPGVCNVRSAEKSTPPPHETNAFASHSLRLTHILITSFSSCFPLKGLIFSSHLSQKEFLWIKETDESIFNIWAQVCKLHKNRRFPCFVFPTPASLSIVFLLHLLYRNQSRTFSRWGFGPPGPFPCRTACSPKGPRCRMRHHSKIFQNVGVGALGVEWVVLIIWHLSCWCHLPFK